MIQAEDFLAAAGAHGFGLYAGVPCSYLKPLINHVIDAPGLRYVPAANEGDAVAIAAGAALAGLRSVAMFQNSGLGNAVNPLTSLNQIFSVPVLVIVTLRGEPGGPPDEPQHRLMGAITTAMLDLMQVSWSWFPAEAGEIGPALALATRRMAESGAPHAFVMRKGSVAAHPLASRPPAAQQPEVRQLPALAPVASRHEVLRAVQAAAGPEDLLVATTGYTGRELYALDDRPNQLYMVGSMGCAPSLGLGLALARPDRRVIVLDGDGAALMRLGAQTTLGQQQPANLAHLLLDNGVHESTGGQATVSPLVDFCAIAAAAGYPSVAREADPQRVAARLRARVPGLSFMHVPIHPGVPEKLPRPSRPPSEQASRLRAWLGAAA
ncbi:MAG: phosphonopyruvate decarboxylase [Chromatiales bacterium]|nr:phosphonopyruvate decarboxylase [Chromatiales bacterium]